MTVRSPDSVREARAILTSAAGIYAQGKEMLDLYRRGPEEAAAALLDGEIPAVCIPASSGSELLEAAAALGVGFLTPEDPQWPAALKDLDGEAAEAAGMGPVFGLWYRGDLAALEGARVGVLGERDSSGYGNSVATDFGAALAHRKTGLVTGNAFGVERAAALSAAAAGGRVILVQASGAEKSFPAGNEDVFSRVLDGGGIVVSDKPHGTVATRSLFLARNRITAALSDAVVITEARWASSSLHAAARARRLNRPVGAVPGSVYSAMSAGCHRLLKEGSAVCVTDAADLAELAGIRAY